MENGAQRLGRQPVPNYPRDDTEEEGLEGILVIQTGAWRNVIMYKESFGKNFTACMKERGWSKEKAAAIFEVSTSMIYLYMSGTNLPEGIHLARVADIFDVSIDWLLGRAENPHSHKLK